MVVFPLPFPYNKLKRRINAKGGQWLVKEEQLIAEVLYGEETADRSRYALYENGTYMVISKFAYLIGVPFHIFENEHEPPKMEWYEALEKDKNARIIRNLCMLRTAFERNYRNIYQAMRYDLKGIASMPEYIPRECIDQLSADGLSIYVQRIPYIKRFCSSSG